MAELRRRASGENKKHGFFTVAAAAAAVLALIVIVLVLSTQKADQVIFELYDKARMSLGLLDNSAQKGIAVHFIDVGEGDCTLVQCGGRSMLIDAGENGYSGRISEYLRHCGIRKLDYAAATHPHSDHIGSLDEIIDEFSPENVVVTGLIPGTEPENSDYTDFERSVERSGANVITAVAGKYFMLGDAKVTVIAPVHIRENLNDMSLVIRVDYGEISFLFQGDAELEEEKDIIENGGAEYCDVIKAGHHGSSSSSSADYIELVSPRYAVISVGAENDYGHPSDKAVKSLCTYAERVYRTDINGDIVFSSDGKELFVP